MPIELKAEEVLVLVLVEVALPETPEPPDAAEALADVEDCKVKKNLRMRRTRLRGRKTHGRQSRKEICGLEGLAIRRSRNTGRVRRRGCQSTRHRPGRGCKRSELK